MNRNILKICGVPESVLALSQSDVLKSLAAIQIKDGDNGPITITIDKQLHYYDKLTKEQPEQFTAIINGFGRANEARSLALQILKKYVKGSMTSMPWWHWPKAFEEFPKFEEKRLLVLDGLYKDISGPRLEAFISLLKDHNHRRVIVIMYDADPFNTFRYSLHYKPTAILNVGNIPKKARIL